MEIMRATFEAALTALGLHLESQAKDHLLAYFELLLARNKQVNLISARQPRPVQVVTHLVDSLTPLLWTDWPAEGRALDLGSGGGLPALPLALARPGWSWDLAEATGKKAAFLGQAQAALGLSRVMIIPAYLKPGVNEQGRLYDLVTARGLAALGDLAALAGPRLETGGRFLAFKGPRGEEELGRGGEALKNWNLELERRLDLTLPLVEARRTLFLFRKK
ncbi:MAG: 16S rRNA (guanine(527)-N(7))-methyltransferase RsmG [Deltaproteobacteria bacterium]|nr:16S rRNA (guanine(527)-N(7))-methyltransferase RsmG [Deltaproteobacteria bacterium]